MRTFWDRIFGLDYDLSIWVEVNDLGTEKLISHKKRSYYVKIPPKIDKKITLRLRGLGKTRHHKTGDLFLHLWLNKGEDITKNLWLSETLARNGGDKIISVDGSRIIMVVPPKSYHGITIRLKGLGKDPFVDPRAPALDDRVRGNLLVKLFVYPDRITPQYGRFDALSTDDMYWEGWIYRKFDEVLRKFGAASLPVHPLQADAIADRYNERGCRGVFDALVNHLNLAHLEIELAESASLPRPGNCQVMSVQKNSQTGKTYRITIKKEFLDNPFSIAAILAHELCHVIYWEKFGHNPIWAGIVNRSEKETLEIEHTVDLLVFIFRVGEFQLRVAKDKGLTFGYFNQDLFERMQVIVSGKLDSIHRADSSDIDYRQNNYR